MVIYERTRLDVKDSATDGAPIKREVDYGAPSDASRLRLLLDTSGLSQRGAAKELDIDERTMRRYCAGELNVPRVVMLALERVAQMRGEIK